MPPFAVTLALVLAATPARAPASLVPPPVHLRLVFGGDVIPHDPVKQAARLHARAAGKDELVETANHDGWDQVFGALGPAFKRADVAMVNLETPISTEESRAREFYFSGPPALLDALKAAGVTVASFANNHCLDRGPQGIVETRQHLAEAGLLSVGADKDLDAAFAPLVLKRQGLRIGVLAATRWLNMHPNPKDPTAPHAPLVLYGTDVEQVGLDEASFVEKVRATAKSVDVLLVAMHWGQEYHPQPLKEDKAFARALLEAGAVAVIGHHPHVLQPVELVRRANDTDGVVAYSLGNLVSNQALEDPASPTRDGMLLEVDVEKPFGSPPARVTRVAVVPTYTENRAAKDKRRNVQARLLDEEVPAMEERLATLEARTDDDARKERKALDARLDVARRRVERIRAMLATPAEPTRPHAPVSGSTPGSTPTPTRASTP